MAILLTRLLIFVRSIALATVAGSVAKTPMLW
jgi:hypothetical protein